MLQEAPEEKPGAMDQSEAKTIADREKQLQIHAKANKNKNREALRGRIMDFEGDFTPPEYPKSDEARKFLDKALGQNFIFSDLTDKEREMLINAMQKQEAKEGEMIIKQGDVGDFFYICEEGTVNFIADGNAVGSCGMGGSFGELALLYDSPRAATCMAGSDCVLWKVDQGTFRHLLARTAQEEESSNDKLLTLPLSEWKKELKTGAPLLTTITRERMEMEISLLESLAESDDAIPELWNLWYNARGPEAAKELHQTEALVAQGQPEAWAKAEIQLKKLIAREGIHWAEPVNRLATLMFLQSRHEESKELCEIVLTLKPWHFGALSGMVMVLQGLQDTEGMLDYARQRMPPLPKKGQEEKEPPKELGELETRQMWVDRMLDRARAKLLGLEMGLEEAFMDLDKEEKELEPALSISNSTDVDEAATDALESTRKEEEEEEEDAWQ